MVDAHGQKLVATLAVPSALPLAATTSFFASEVEEQRERARERDLNLNAVLAHATVLYLAMTSTGSHNLAQAEMWFRRSGELLVQLTDQRKACAAATARRAYRRGRLPGNCLRRWRSQLDAALHRGIAAQLVSARFGLPGRGRRRHALADLTVLEARCPL